VEEEEEAAGEDNGAEDEGAGKAMGEEAVGAEVAAVAEAAAAGEGAGGGKTTRARATNGTGTTTTMAVGGGIRRAAPLRPQEAPHNWHQINCVFQAVPDYPTDSALHQRSRAACRADLEYPRSCHRCRASLSGIVARYTKGTSSSQVDMEPLPGTRVCNKERLWAMPKAGLLPLFSAILIIMKGT